MIPVRRTTPYFLLLLFILHPWADPVVQGMDRSFDPFHSPASSDSDGDGIGHRLGIYLTGEMDDLIHRGELVRMAELGFTILELDEPRLSELLGRNPDFQEWNPHHLFLRQSRAFTTWPDLALHDSLYLRQDQELILNYYLQPDLRIAAVGLFAWPDDRSPETVRLMNRHAESLRSLFTQELPLYYHSAWEEAPPLPSAFSFRSVRNPGTDQPSGGFPPVVHFDPGERDTRSLNGLKQILEHSLGARQSIILLPWPWLRKQLEQFPPLNETLKTYTQKGEVIFPLPYQQEETPTIGWIPLLFLLLLGSYLLHYRYNPSYGNSLFRYFLIHRYFVENTVEYRFRSFLTGGVLFIQHLLLTGILFHIFSTAGLSSLGRQALKAHFPVLSPFFNSPEGFFLLGFLVALLLQSLSVIWIHFFNRQTRLSQTLALYCWPLHLNLLNVLAVVVLYQSGRSSAGVVLFTLLFLGIWFFAFTIASIDLSRLLKRYKTLYLLGTAGAHTLLMMLLLLLLFLYAPVTQPLRLALSLP